VGEVIGERIPMRIHTRIRIHVRSITADAGGNVAQPFTAF
jgi:hypothetical protein